MAKKQAAKKDAKPKMVDASVHRHATIESMNRQREAWDEVYITALRASRQP